MPDIRFTGTYLLSSVYDSVFRSTGRADNMPLEDISLKDILGESVEISIYLEIPLENVQTPYITIRQLDSGKKIDSYNHYWRHALFDVEYIPDDSVQSKNIELLEISEVLIVYLTRVKTPTGVNLHARSLKSEIIDGVLHVFADYEQLTVEPVPDAPTMETIDHNVYIKDDTERTDK